MIKKEIEKILANALRELSVAREYVSVERPKDSGNGDYSTNIALMYAKEVGKDPKELASDIKNRIEASKNDMIERVEVAGPGFVNFFLTRSALAKAIDTAERELTAGCAFKAGRDISVEFISANPTGDLHIGHGRGAFYGDMLANILAYAGANVTREYYINDSRDSAQIRELGKTALGAGKQYLTKKVQALIAGEKFSGLSEGEAGFKLAEKIQESNKKFIEKKLGISFDVWYSEDAEIRAKGVAEKLITELKKKELTYEKDDAVWLKTSEFGDDEDRVIVRSDGSPTYFVADLCYHGAKFGQGHDTVIDVWGADHHGHVKRMAAAKEMLGWRGELLIFVTQLVSLKEGGEAKKMSKRAGTVVLLEDLVNEFDIDVVRWFFAEKALGTHMEFDAALAKEKSEKNPVFYVQYAHARIASIVRNAAALAPDGQTVSEALEAESARLLASKLAEFPEVVEDIAYSYHAHKLTTYAYELAQAFSGFYRDVRVIEENNVHAGALMLAKATKATLAKTLSLLGISAPEKM